MVGLGVVGCFAIVVAAAAGCAGTSPPAVAGDAGGAASGGLGGAAGALGGVDARDAAAGGRGGDADADAGADRPPTASGGSGGTSTGPDDAGSGILTAVVVGYGGKRVSTIDGVNWANFDQIDPNGGDDTNLLRGVGFGDGVFVAVGGFVITSPDGATWTDRGPTSNFLAADAFLSNVVWLNGRFIAAGGNGSRVRSLDHGATWVDVQGFQPLHYRDIAAGNGVAVAVGHTYEGVGIVAITSDGAQWTETVHAGTSLNKMAFGNGVFVAVGDTGRCARSTNGMTWTDCTISGLTGVIIFTGTEFILSTSTGVYRSTDGAAWATVTVDREVSAWFNGNYINFAWPAKLWATTDLSHWTAVFSPGGSGWVRLAQGRVAR